MSDSGDTRKGGVPTTPARERFLRHVDSPDMLTRMAQDHALRRSHVLWTGAAKFRLYGRGKRIVRPARASMLLFGDYPQAITLSVRIICGEKRCVNPWHMELWLSGREQPVEGEWI